MSFVDLATVAVHRRHEMEARIVDFLKKCDTSIQNVLNLRLKAQGFVEQLKCEPSELKDRFLNCMKQLDEFTYLITDFNLALEKLDETSNAEITPVQDIKNRAILPPPSASSFNLIDALSEPIPSTSKACHNQCPSEKPQRKKVPKEDQLLIAFSSSSCSAESIQMTKTATVEKEIQCQIPERGDVANKDSPTLNSPEHCVLPAQSVVPIDSAFTATIMHIDGSSFWVITDNVDDVYNLMTAMTDYYKENPVEMDLDQVTSLNNNYCAYYDDDSDCYYRGLFFRLSEVGQFGCNSFLRTTYVLSIVGGPGAREEWRYILHWSSLMEIQEDMSVAELFLVDTGELRSAPITTIQPLIPAFCVKPPYARCCHLAGVDIIHHQDRELMEEVENFMRSYIGTVCCIEVDDNTSESLGVYVTLPTGDTLNDIIVKQGLAVAVDRSQSEKVMKQEVDDERPGKPRQSPLDLAELDEALDITKGPEYDDPLEAVTGYRNRDEAEICKHYKGGPEKTCFKGSRCNKKHILMHPDGWTMDQVPVVGKCRSLPLPAPGTWLRLTVTHVPHFDRFYAHIAGVNEKEPVPSFGVVLPPTTLEGLIRDMNCPATRMSYKPLKTIPAPGELVAALYPLDGQWYRARVLSVTRADQNVEVQYIDYGNSVWVKEDEVRVLPQRHIALPAQALRCALAGVRATSTCSRHWAAAKNTLSALLADRTLEVHVVARDYDEITVEVFDDGYNVAEHLVTVSSQLELTEYAVIDDTSVDKKLIVP